MCNSINGHEVSISVTAIQVKKQKSKHHQHLRSPLRFPQGYHFPQRDYYSDFYGNDILTFLFNFVMKLES